MKCKINVHSSTGTCVTFIYCTTDTLKDTSHPLHKCYSVAKSGCRYICLKEHAWTNIVALFFQVPSGCLTWNREKELIRKARGIQWENKHYDYYKKKLISVCYVDVYYTNFCHLWLLKVFVFYQYCIVLYCIVLYCIVLYCIVLYCIVYFRAWNARLASLHLQSFIMLYVRAWNTRLASNICICRILYSLGSQMQNWCPFICLGFVAFMFE